MSKLQIIELQGQVERKDARILELEAEKKDLIQTLGRQELRYQDLEAEYTELNNQRD